MVAARAEELSGPPLHSIFGVTAFSGQIINRCRTNSSWRDQPRALDGRQAQGEHGPSWR